MTTELSAQLSEEFGVKLEAGFVFDFPSVGEQSVALTALLAGDHVAVAAELPSAAATAPATDPGDLTEAELIETAMAELSAWQKDLHG